MNVMCECVCVCEKERERDVCETEREYVCVCVSKVVRARVQVWAEEMNDTVCKKSKTKKLISEENEQKNLIVVDKD